jgi:hypothetical protein
LLSAIHREYQAGLETMVLHPLYLLGGSLLLGFAASIVTLVLARWIGKRRDQHLALLLSMIAILVGASFVLKLPELLVMLTFGVLVTNMDEEHALMPIETGRFGQVFYVVLFVVTGATFNLVSAATTIAISLIYIAARFVGKSIGVLGLAHLSGIRPGSGGLLSLALTPMSGGALALAFTAASPYPEFGQGVEFIVLGASLILELLGPALVQFALRRAGETQEEGA